MSSQDNLSYGDFKGMIKENKSNIFYKVYGVREDGGHDEFKSYPSAIRYLMTFLETSTDGSNLPQGGEQFYFKAIIEKIKRHELIAAESTIGFSGISEKESKGGVKKYKSRVPIYSRIVELCDVPGQNGMPKSRLILELSKGAEFSESAAYITSCLSQLMKKGKILKVKKGYYRSI
jgi:hypothetical protein